MGKKPKSSRKGKKAWRANISTDDFDDYVEKSTKDALSGGSLAGVSTENLVFVDKSKDFAVKRKIEKHRERVLRCDSVLQKNPFVHAVPSSLQQKKNKRKKKKKEEEERKKNSETNDVVGATQDGYGPVTDSGMVDIWKNEDQGELDSKAKKRSKPSVIPAVEVEPAGCSYNPSFEAHQDSLAQAVAEEMQKVYQSELGPLPVPLIVPGKVIDEEDVDNGSDDDANEDNLRENDDTALEKRSVKMKRVTRVELNRRARHKEHQRKEAELKKKEELSKEIDCLPDIIQEIAREDEEKQKRHTRRIVAKEERLKIRPPRLGKHKFEPAPAQVLLSEEITGSLRKLKGCCTLARDRFKSLEKRGLIAPAKSRRVTFITDSVEDEKEMIVWELKDGSIVY